MDWITFTMTPRYGTYDTEGLSTGDDYAKAIEQAWHRTFDTETLAVAFGGTWAKQERSRAPYTDSWVLDGRGITLFAGITLNHCCVEISGEGCEILIRESLLTRVVEAVADRVTRIDIACDIETTVTPSAFAEQRAHKRFQAEGYMHSKSGQTVYVGSKKSERFARVYRYAKPHPRAHLLRVEHVFHKAYAKTVAKEIVHSGIDKVSVSAGLAFGWAHAVWDTKTDDAADISIVAPERNAGKTVFWLITSVSPAFKRLCDNGTIRDPEEFIKRYFLSDTKDA